MKFGSVCSGIEAASVAFRPLGWKASWFSEIEPFPCAVLAHHYPDVPNLGDMTTIRARIDSGEVEAPDMLCGGTPCQSFSVAGLRRSLEDERGNLSLEFIRIADAIDRVRRAAGKPPAWILWENVPGVLSTRDNAFGAFLGGLCGGDAAIPAPADGWPGAGVVAGPGRVVAWRVLDAQFFGVAQRRKRVFVLALGGPGGWACADALLPVGDRMHWHPAPRREARQGSAAGTLRSTDGGSDVDHARARHIVSTIDASFGRLQGCSGQDANHGHSHLVAFGGNNTGGPIDVAAGLNAKGGAGRMDFDSETFITFAATDYESGAFDQVDQAAPLTTSADRTRAAPILAFSAKDHGADAQEDLSPTLRAGGHAGSHANAGVMPAIAFKPGQSEAAGGTFVTEEYAPTLQGQNNGSTAVPSVMAAMQVRRLTPRECERLQGFPDDYTAVPHRGKPAADGPRYKALGNSWAVPVVSWIGKRIGEVQP